MKLLAPDEEIETIPADSIKDYLCQVVACRDARNKLEADFASKLITLRSTWEPFLKLCENIIIMNNNGASNYNNLNNNNQCSII